MCFERFLFTCWYEGFESGFYPSLMVEFSGKNKNKKVFLGPFLHFLTHFLDWALKGCKRISFVLALSQIGVGISLIIAQQFLKKNCIPFCVFWDPQDPLDGKFLFIHSCRILRSPADLLNCMFCFNLHLFLHYRKL